MDDKPHRGENDIAQREVRISLMSSQGREAPLEVQCWTAVSTRTYLSPRSSFSFVSCKHVCDAVMSFWILSFLLPVSEGHTFVAELLMTINVGPMLPYERVL
jgi:hypothetical protein